MDYVITSYALRLALKEDLPSIKELIHLGEINPTGLDWKRFVVATNPDGEVIGCGQLKPHGKEILELASIVVDPEYRNLGVARASGFSLC